MAEYSMHYPALTDAHVEGPDIKDDAILYTFVTRIGTKGTVKANEKTPDFNVMHAVATILLADEDEEPGMPPSEVLELI